jgi:PrgI family protein
MASYHIPQFLDSGDKIFGPLNVRQFGYALAGGLLSFITFTIIQSLVPGLGVYALVPVLPIVALFGYLAFGKYNGRDSEIYILKIIIYFLKPRFMVYARVVDTSDLDEQLSKLTFDNISKEWAARIAQTTVDENAFENHSARMKADKIRELGINIDIGQRNALQSVIRNTVANEISQNSLEALLPHNQNHRYTQSLLLNKKDNIQPIINPDYNIPEANYFDEKPKQ